MAAMPSPAGWAALAVVVGLIATAWTLVAKALSTPSPPFGQGGYGAGTEAEKRRRHDAAPEAGDESGAARRPGAKPRP